MIYMSLLLLLCWVTLVLAQLGANVQVDPTRLVEIKVQDTVHESGQRVVRGSVPISRNFDVYSADNIQVLKKVGQDYNEIAADVWAFNRHGGLRNDLSKPIWWAGVFFRTPSAVAADQDSRFYIHHGDNVQRGAPATPMSVVDGNEAVVIDTPTHTFEVSKQRGTLLDKVVLKSDPSTPLVAGGGTGDNLNGISAIDSPSGTVYRSAHDTSPSISVEESGDVHAVVRVETWLKRPSTPSDEYLKVICRVTFVLGADGDVHFDCIVANPGPIDMNAASTRHRRYTDLRLTIFMDNLGAGTRQLQMTEFDVRDTFAQGSTQRWLAFQDYTTTNYDIDAGCTGCDPTPMDMIDNFFVQVHAPNGSVVYNKGNVHNLLSGSRSHGVFGIGSATRHVHAAVTNFWEKSPRSLAIEGDRMEVHFVAADERNVLVHPRGPMLKTDAADSSTYSSYVWGADVGNMALVYDPDEVAYTLHSGGQNYNRVAFRFADGALPDSNALRLFGALQQERPVPLAADPAYYRTSGAFWNQFGYVELRDWDTYTSMPPILRAAAERSEKWALSLWDDTMVQPNYPSSYYYTNTTYVNRLKSGVVSGGVFGYPSWGLYWGALPWPDGWLHTAYDTGRTLVTSVLRSARAEGFTQLWGMLENDGLRAPYFWKDPTDEGAGYVAYEKGNIMYGFAKGSARHTRHVGSALAALVHAHESMAEVNRMMTVLPAQGYPHATNQPGVGWTVGFVGDLTYGGPYRLAVAMVNLAAFYQLTGDPEYVRIGMRWADTYVKNYEPCVQQYSEQQYKFLVARQSPSPSMASSPVYQCTDFTHPWTQSFMIGYMMTGIMDVLEADRHLHGTINQTLVDFVTGMARGPMDLLYTLPPQTDTNYSPFTYPGSIYMFDESRHDNGGNLYCYGDPEMPRKQLGNNWVVYGCRSTTSGVDSWAPVLAWLFVQTGNSTFLEWSSVMARDFTLFRSSNAGPKTLSPPKPSEWSTISWRQLNAGSADVKTFGPVPQRLMGVWLVLGDYAQTCSDLNGVFCAASDRCEGESRATYDSPPGSACCLTSGGLQCTLDAEAPVVAVNEPSQPLPSLVTLATVVLGTSERANCRRGDATSAAYDQLTPADDISSDGAKRVHTFTVGNLTPDSTTNVYVSCVDVTPQQNQRDNVLVTIVVDSPDTTAPVISQFTVDSLSSQASSLSWVTDDYSECTLELKDPVSGNAVFTGVSGDRAAVLADPLVVTSALKTTHSVSSGNVLAPSSFYRAEVTCVNADGLTTPTAAIITMLTLPSPIDTVLQAGVLALISEGRVTSSYQGVSVGYGGGWMKQTAGLVEVDLSQLPAGVENLNVQMKVRVRQAVPATMGSTVAVNVYLLSTEPGMTTASGGSHHTPAQTGESTWQYAKYTSVPWTMEGGDVHASPMTSFDVATDTHAFSTVDVTALFEAWLSGAVPNFGLLLRADDPNAVPQLFLDQISFAVSGNSLAPTCTTGATLGACAKQDGLCAGSFYACTEVEATACAATYATLNAYADNEDGLPCDAVDNDCDGTVDENCTGAPITTTMSGAAGTTMAGGSTSATLSGGGGTSSGVGAVTTAGSGSSDTSVAPIVGDEDSTPLIAGLVAAAITLLCLIACGIGCIVWSRSGSSSTATPARRHSSNNHLGRSGLANSSDRRSRSSRRRGGTGSRGNSNIFGAAAVGGRQSYTRQSYTTRTSQYSGSTGANPGVFGVTATPQSSYNNDTILMRPMPAPPTATANASHYANIPVDPTANIVYTQMPETSFKS